MVNGAPLVAQPGVGAGQGAVGSGGGEPTVSVVRRRSRAWTTPSAMTMARPAPSTAATPKGNRRWKMRVGDALVAWTATVSPLPPRTARPSWRAGPVLMQLWRTALV